MVPTIRNRAANILEDFTKQRHAFLAHKIFLIATALSYKVKTVHIYLLLFLCLLSVGCDNENKSTFYYESGKKRLEENKNLGERNGLSTGWYENGQKQFEARYKDGKEHGIWIFWYQNGQKEQEVNWKNGKKDGVAILWKPSGMLDQFQSWKNNKKHGEWKIWHENGRLAVTSNYNNGIKDGPWKFWYNNGQIEEISEWKEDRLLSIKCWKPDGNECPVSYVKNGKGIKVVYNNDGTEQRRLQYNDQ